MPHAPEAGNRTRARPDRTLAGATIAFTGSLLVLLASLAAMLGEIAIGPLPFQPASRHSPPFDLELPSSAPDLPLAAATLTTLEPAGGVRGDTADSTEQLRLSNIRMAFGWPAMIRKPYRRFLHSSPPSLDRPPDQQSPAALFEEATASPRPP